MPAAAVDAVLAALDDDAMSVSAFEDGGDGSGSASRWWVELIHRRCPDPEALAAQVSGLLAQGGLVAAQLDLAPLAPTDWLAAVGERFPPLRLGRFWVHGSHVRKAPPAGSVPIRIDAGLAFGTGEHASTAGCLAALEALARRRRPRRVLDLGCGSAILAIAAAKLWPARVLAVDNDPVAVAVAAENVARNGVATRVRALVGDGYAHPALRAAAPFDLVLANILADPLIEMAGALARHLAPGGHAVLAGLLDRQEAAVLAAHRPHGLALRRRMAIGPWVTLVLGRTRRGRNGPAEAASTLGRSRRGR